MSKWSSGLLAFVTAASVLVLEIIAARMLAPYVGVSLQTYTAIISTVLAGISLGAWLGGRLADRFDARRWLGSIIIVGGAGVMASLPILRIVGPHTSRGGALAALTLAGAAFLLPAIVLSMVPPILVKLTMSSLNSAGRDVGRISALGTAGAIVGSLVSGFLLSATLASSVILISLGTFLVVLGVLTWILLRPTSGKLPVAALGLSLIAAVLVPAYQSKCQLETSYFCASIINDPYNESGRYLILDGITHSYVDLDDPTNLRFEYVRAIGSLVDVVKAKDEPIRAIHVGGGGFTIPNYVRATRTGSTNLVLERDPELIALDERELGLMQGNGLTAVAADGRVELRQRSENDWDLVVGDAFGAYSIPWHLATVEYVRDISDRLTDDGIYAQNVIDQPPLHLLKADIATVESVFEHVIVVARPEYLSGDQGGNFVVLASNVPLPTDALVTRFAERNLRYDVLQGNSLDDFVGGAGILTDDFAPVDDLITLPA